MFCHGSLYIIHYHIPCVDGGWGEKWGGGEGEVGIWGLLKHFLWGFCGSEEGVVNLTVCECPKTLLLD